MFAVALNFWIFCTAGPTIFITSVKPSHPCLNYAPTIATFNLQCTYVERLLADYYIKTCSLSHVD